MRRLRSLFPLPGFAARGFGRRRRPEAPTSSCWVAERLEDRALLSALDPRNLLISTSAPPGAAGYAVWEFTRAGQAKQSFVVPYGFGTRPAGEAVRDLAVDAAGRVHVYNGTATPLLSTLDPVAGTWTHNNFRAWNTVAADGHGGVAVVGNRVFATDTRTQSDSVSGLVRFDVQGNAAVNPARFSEFEQYEDVAAGLDGFVYGLELSGASAGSIVRKFDAASGTFLGKLTLQTSEDVRGVAVDASGNIFAVSWTGSLLKFDAAGNLLLRKNVNEAGIAVIVTAAESLIDVDVAADGAVVAGGRFGDAYLTDASFGGVQRIDAGTGPAYVAFASYTPPPAMIRGTVFTDRDGDGVRDIGEPANAGVTVYLDLDRDGTPDAGEPTATTLADGTYRFAVAAGEYLVRQVVPTGYRETSPGPTAGFYYAAGRDADLWRIEPASGEATRVGWTGGVVLHGLVRTNDGRLFGINGYDGVNDGFYSVDPATGAATLIGRAGLDLAWGLAYDAATDTIYGIGTINGYNRLGTFSRSTGLFTPVSGGLGAPAGDLDRTSGIAFDPINRRVVAYEHADGHTWQFTLGGVATKLLTDSQAATIAGVSLNLTHDGRRFVMKRDFGPNVGELLELDPDAGTLTRIGAVSASFLAESLEFVPGVAFAHTITVRAGATTNGLDFGNRPLSGEIRGTVWDDQDFDKVRDEGEPGRAGVTVYLDLNNNGYFEPSGTRPVTVDPDAYGYGTVLENAVTGVTLKALTPGGQTFDTVKSLGQHPTLGRLFGHREPYGAESILWGLTFPTLRADFATPTTSVDVTFRAYSGTAVAFLRAYAADGTLLAQAAEFVTSAGPKTLTVAADAGIAYVTATSENAFVLIDKLTFSERFAEPTAVTAADGTYSFTGLSPGRYFVGMVEPRGWVRTTNGNERNVYYGTAYDPGSGGALRLVTVDAVTGHVAWIGEPLPVYLSGLVRTNSGDLYGVNWQSDGLYRIDAATGRVELVGNTGYQIVASLAYDPNSDRLYTVGKVADSDEIARLMVIDPRTGRATPLGPGIGDMTGTSSLVYDVLRNRVIAFDNADGEFIAFDWAGNGTLLSTGPNVRTYAFSAAPGYRFVLQPHATGNGFLATVNPDTALLGEPRLTLSQAVLFESLDWNYAGWRYAVDADGVAAGVDFGVYDGDWAPSAAPGGPYEVREGSPLTLSGAGSSDSDDDPLTYEWDLKADGTIDATGVSPTFTWEQLVALGMEEDGTYSVRLKVLDPAGNSSTDHTTLTVLNAAPAAVADRYETSYGKTLTVAAAGVLANDADAGSDPLTAVLVAGPAHGTLALAADGSFTYAPAAGFAGADAFTYRVSDGSLSSDPVTVTVDVVRPVLAVGDVSVREGHAGTTQAVLTLRLSRAAAADVTVTYATADGSAAAGVDYAAASGSITFLAGETEKAIGLAVLGDALSEGAEAFAVNLTASGGGVVAPDPRPLVSVVDDDPRAALSVSDVRIAEGDPAAARPAALSFKVSADRAAANAYSVRYRFVAGTAAEGADYSAPAYAGTLAFAAGQTVKYVAVTLAGDAASEPDETLRLVLEEVLDPSRAVLLDAEGVGTIANDDVTVSVSPPAAVAEGGFGAFPVARFAVTLSRAVSHDVSVAYATASPTAAELSARGLAAAATAGSDYLAAAGTLVIKAGATVGYVDVPVFGDGLDEPDEGLKLLLSAPANAKLGTASAVAALTDDDAAPAVSVSDVRVLEGTGGAKAAVFTVSLSASSGRAVTVNYATADGTALAGTAAAGGDYAAKSATLTFAAGTTALSQTVTVALTADSLDESDEAFFLDLTSAANASVAAGRATAFLVDDDPGLPWLSASDAKASEGGTLSFTVTPSAAFGPGGGSARYRLVGGSAAEGADYVAKTGVLTWAAGSAAAQRVSVAALQDAASEPDEALRLELFEAAGAGLFDAEGIGTITNDDVTVSASAPAVLAEGASGAFPVARFAVTLSRAVSHDVSVAYKTASPSSTELAAGGLSAAAAGSDYLAASGTLVIAAGQTVGYVDVPLLGDDRDEPDLEAFKLLLSGPVNAKLGAASALARVADDDAAPVASVSGVRVLEPGPGGTRTVLVTVTLSAPSLRPVTVDWAAADGTATAGADYAAASGRLTFSAGKTSLTVALTVTGDGDPEGEEAFLLRLLSADGATLGVSEAEVGLVDALFGAADDLLLV